MNNQPNIIPSAQANSGAQNFNGNDPMINDLSGVNIGSSLRSYFAVTLKWWWMILLIVGLVTTLATLWAKRITPAYRATTTIEIKQQESNILGGQIIDETNANLEFIVTQIALLKSTTLAETVVEDLGLQNNTRFTAQSGSREQKVALASKKILNNVIVSRVRGSRLISIAYEDTDPRLSAKVTNQLAENFVRFNQERKYNATAYARDFVRDRLNTTKVALEESCLLYTSPSPRDRQKSRMPSSA